MDTDHIADRLDDLGIGILASPYIAKAVGNLAGHALKIPALGAGGAGTALRGIQSGTHAFENAFHANPYAEIAGLGLVAPGVVKPLAEKITEKTAFQRGYARACAVLLSRHAELDK